MLGKNWKAVKGLLAKLLGNKGSKNAATALEKSKQKVTGYNQPGKKSKIKGTSVTGASKPITNAQEAKVMQNIDTKHVDAQGRKLVEQHMDDIVTPEMQAAYDKSIAYKPLKPNQKAAKAKIDAANTVQRAELNSVQNNAKGAEKLGAVENAAQKAETAAKTIKDGAHINPANKNTYYTKDGHVTQIRTAIPNSKGEYTITDPVKIAKHLSKHNVKLEDFALEKATAQAA